MGDANVTILFCFGLENRTKEKRKIWSERRYETGQNEETDKIKAVFCSICQVSMYM